MNLISISFEYYEEELNLEFPEGYYTWTSEEFHVKKASILQIHYEIHIKSLWFYNHLKRSRYEYGQVDFWMHILCTAHLLCMYDYNNRVHCDSNVVSFCLHIIPSHAHFNAQLSEYIEHMR